MVKGVPIQMMYWLDEKRIIKNMKEIEIQYSQKIKNNQLLRKT
jgi:hypothetical protein